MDDVFAAVKEAPEELQEQVRHALQTWMNTKRPGVFRFVSDIEIRKETTLWRIEDMTLGAMAATILLTGGYLIYKKLNKKTEKE